MCVWQLHQPVQIIQRFRQVILLLQLEIIPRQHRVIIQSRCRQTQRQEATRSLLRVIIPNRLTLLLLEIILLPLRVIIQSRCQQGIIQHPHRVIIRNQVHQKNIQHQARLELILHQAEVATEVAADTVVAAVLEAADQALQTDLDK